MEVILGVVISREFSWGYSENFPRLRFHREAIHTFEQLLKDGLLEFKTDLVEELSMTLICLSPTFSAFFKPHRPKYYEDRTLKCPGSVTPEVRMYKSLTADFVVDFEGYYNLSTKEECLQFLALSFLDFLKNLKYPGKLKKFEKEKLFQAVRDIFVKNSILSVDDGI